jgi:hypothetical protein
VVVDATWHHFFDINLTGDRYLEDNQLPPAHRQKLYGFYVPDGKGGWVPNEQYRMIMWYFRNLIYWLNPAGRYQTIGWQTLADVTKRPRFLEELVPARDDLGFTRFGLAHFLYFGHLAAEYLSLARGACAVHAVETHILGRGAPWADWVDEYVDIWDPVRSVGDGDTSG